MTSLVRQTLAQQLFAGAGASLACLWGEGVRSPRPSGSRAAASATGTRKGPHRRPRSRRGPARQAWRGPISSASLSPLMLFSRTLVNKRLNGCREGVAFAGAGPLTSGAPLGCGHGQPHAQRTHSTARAGPPASGSAARSPAEGAGDGSDNKTWRALCSAVRWEPPRPCYGRWAPWHPALQHQCPL